MIRRHRFHRRMARRRPAMAYHDHRPAIPPKLVEAHRLFDAGEFGKAAGLYQELAERAAEKEYPQAPNLYLRSAEAYLKAGQVNHVLDMVFTGLSILVARKNWLQLKKVSSIALERMKLEGKEDLARQVEDWLETHVPERIIGSSVWKKGAVDGSGTVPLPSTCGQCGGPVDSGEVGWHDTSHPICAYCGAGLNAASRL